MGGHSSNRVEEDCEDTLSFASLVHQGNDGVWGSPSRLLPADPDPDFEFHRTAPFSSPSTTATLSSNTQLPPRSRPTLGSIFSASGSSRSSSRSSSGQGSQRRDSGGRPDPGRAASARTTAQPCHADPKWQFFGTGRSAAASPPSSSVREDSRRRTVGAAAMPPEVKPPRGRKGKGRLGLLGFMSSCKVSHAVEPSKQVNSSNVLRRVT